MKKLTELIQLAIEGNWNIIDKEIPRIIKKQEYLAWSISKGMDDQNENVRDLAVSIIEKANIPSKEFSKFETKLYNKMLEDTHKYVRYRSAFALVSHDSICDKGEIIQVLEEAEKDEDVSEIAKKYLRKFK